MTRESKLALIIGFVLVLVVGVLVSDHFSQANTMSLDSIAPDTGRAVGPITDLGQREKQGLDSALGAAMKDRQIAMTQPTQRGGPVMIANGGHASGERNPSNSGSILDRALDHVQSTEFPKALQLSPRTETKETRVSYTSYKIVAGDTLIGIARRMLGDGDRWTHIHRLNADVLGPDAILKIGMTLRLPNDAKATPKATLKTNTLRNSGRTYTVVSGDTLGDISMKLLGTSRRADEIAKLNGLESPNDIRIGMKLKVPTR